jgi:hypothetical protein
MLRSMVRCRAALSVRSGWRGHGQQHDRVSKPAWAAEAAACCAADQHKLRNALMKWPKWSIVRGERGDFMPILFGAIMVVVSLPAFVMLLINPDANSDAIRLPLLVFLGFGTILGTSFIVLGIRVCSYPGSMAYRITHGRIFSR